MADEITGEIDLVAMLRSTQAFAELPDDMLRDLAAETSVLSLADDEIVMQQDQPVTRMYIVLSGVLNIDYVDSRGDRRSLADVLPAQTLGEISVVSDAPAPVTARARGPVLLAEFSRTGFRRFSERCPRGALAVIEALRPQLQRRRLQQALHQSPTFRNVDPGVLADLERMCDPVALYGGEVLFRRGDPGDSLYIVVSGRVRAIARSADGTETVLAELGPGETVGEMAVISGEERSAEVYAIRDTQLARLSKEAVEDVLKRHPKATLVMLAGGLVARVRQMSSGSRRSSAISTIAVVPASPNVPLGAFSERLADAMSQLGTTLSLSSERVDAYLGTGAAQAYDAYGGNTRLLEWLAEKELEHRFVIYQTGTSCSPWAERSLRQADQIVIVADATADATAGEIEAELVNREPARRTRRTLALLHQPGKTPVGTARWLSGRTLDRHVHLRLDDRADFDRLARLLTGNAVGLALGGGFARGLAHLGVFRALRELNIAVDVIGGSSMGAMIGALWALGWEPARIRQQICTSFAKSFDDMTMPFLSFKKGGKHSRVVHDFFGTTQIEDLWIPYFCTSANLNRAELAVHTAGSLATAALASSRAPGIFPPVVIDGELHVDGGLINNTPVDVMRRFSNEGIVIGVDVSPPHELTPVADYGKDISGWQAMWHRFNPTRDKRIYRPSILLVLMRVIELGGVSYGREKADLADVYLEPNLLKFKRNDFHLATEMADVGYATTREMLTEWLATGSAEYGERRPDLFPHAAAIAAS